jgi:hypothetical protein
VAIRSNRSIASVDSIVAEHLTGVGQSVAFVNALHHKNAAQRPIACQCFLQGLPVAAKPSDAEVHAWLWNVAGLDKGTRASPRTVPGSIVRLRSLLVYSFTVWCGTFA